MRTLIFIVCLVSSHAWAGTVSVVEVSLMNAGAVGVEQNYRLVLDDRDSRNDEIHEQGANEVWKRVYKGTLTHVELPEEAHILSLYGMRANKQGLLSYGNYNLKDSANTVGLRVRSGDKLVFMTVQGAVEIDWRGEVLEAKQLNRDFNMFEGISFYLFSVKGRERSGTFLKLNNSSKAHKITDDFRTGDLGSYLEDGIIHFPDLGREIDVKRLEEAEKFFAEGRARAAGKGDFETLLNADIKRKNILQTWFKDPTKDEKLNELIVLLDDREPLDSMPNKAELVSKAIRTMLTDEFPRLVELEKSDASVKQNTARLVEMLTQLWIARKAVNGELIRHSLIRHLEANIPARKKCELSLLSLEGPGSHSLSYYRDEALQAMNTLKQKLYKR